MYKVKLSNEELEAIQRGHTPTILKFLYESDKNITKELKAPGCNVAFLQGASSVVDRLINVLTKKTV